MAVDVNLNAEKQELKIRVSGKFDFGVHQDFRMATEKATDKVKTIVVDLGPTDYLDSTALGMLLVLREKVGDKKESVRITGARPEVKKILQIANFDKLFTLQ
jgi:HptB-dependent secretion and biofilm anti anti-sigma factor